MKIKHILVVIMIKMQSRYNTLIYLHYSQYIP